MPTPEQAQGIWHLVRCISLQDLFYVTLCNDGLYGIKKYEQNNKPESTIMSIIRVVLSEKCFHHSAAFAFRVFFDDIKSNKKRKGRRTYKTNRHKVMTSGPFFRGLKILGLFWHRVYFHYWQRCFSICYVRMLSISKTDYCADRSIPALPFAYQEYLLTFKLMTSQVVQWARPLSGLIWLLGREKVKLAH